MRLSPQKTKLSLLCILSCAVFTFILMNSLLNRDYAKKKKMVSQSHEEGKRKVLAPKEPPKQDDNPQLKVLNEPDQNEILQNLRISLKQSQQSKLPKTSRSDTFQSITNESLHVEQFEHQNVSTGNEKKQMTLNKLQVRKNIFTAKQVNRHTEKNRCNTLRPVTTYETEGLRFTDEELDISTFMDKEPLIPKILHQTWDTYGIPDSAVPYVKSVLKHNPDWDYWFWTKSDVECYMRELHPDYLRLYHSYSATIFKTDFMRYFLLYDYGGIYMDLDVSCLQPLDVWRYMGPAVLSHETYEHVYNLHQKEEANVMTTVLASRQGHPYYKLLQERLAKYHATCASDVLHSTGPYFLDNVYQEYLNMKLSSGTIPDEDTITVIDPIYWLPTYGPNASKRLHKVCSSEQELRRTNEKARSLCDKAIGSNFSNIPDKQSYLEHHWVHSNIAGSEFKKPGKTSIISLIPNFVPVHKKLGLNCSTSG